MNTGNFGVLEDPMNSEAKPRTAQFGAVWRSLAQFGAGRLRPPVPATETVDPEPPAVGNQGVDSTERGGMGRGGR
jgi:hypothetical protein